MTLKYLDPKTQRIYEVSQGIGDTPWMIFYRERLKSGEWSGLRRARIWKLTERVSPIREVVQEYLDTYACAAGWTEVEE